MIAGGLVLWVESRIAGDDLAAFAHASRDAWLGIAYLVVFGSLVGFTAFAYALNELPATTVGTYAYVNPVVAVLLGHFFLKEPLSAGLLAGGTLILLAVLITTGVLRRAPAAPEPAPNLGCEEAV
jgi:drug/metabolite transporter (DMT)-like permease